MTSSAHRVSYAFCDRAGSPIGATASMLAPMRALAVVSVVVLGASSPALAQVYEVGPGQTYADISDVPLDDLEAGDEVRIHYRAEPYRETFGLDVSGTAAAPIVIRGVRGPGGELPIIDGEDSTAGPGAQRRGLVTINGGAYVTIEDLEIRNGHADHGFARNTAAVYVPAGDHITLRGLDVHHSGNGLFSWIDSSDVLIEGCYVHDNGNVGSNFEHNVYTESRRITFQYNRLGPLLDGATGNNLKDRSEGTVIRYNWIEGGNRPLDLVEAEDLSPYDGSVPTFVYGNVLIKIDDTGQDQVVHFGQDNGLPPRTLLYFVHNTVYSTRSGNTDVLFVNAPATAHVVNNIIHHTGSGMRLLDPDSDDATVELGPNWITAGWQRGQPGATFVGEDMLIEGSDPGFAGAPTDFSLVSGSPARDAGGALPGGAPAVDRELRPGGSAARGSDGMPDLGAFEYCETGCTPIPAADAGTDRDAGEGLDAGAGSDAGRVPGVDGGRVDGGTSPVADAGRRTEGGGGCSCRAGGDRSTPWLIFGAIAMLAVRRLRVRT
jgi:hypothetical protein